MLSCKTAFHTRQNGRDGLTCMPQNLLGYTACLPAMVVQQPLRMSRAPEQMYAARARGVQTACPRLRTLAFSMGDYSHLIASSFSSISHHCHQSATPKSTTPQGSVPGYEFKSVQNPTARREQEREQSQSNQLKRAAIRPRDHKIKGWKPGLNTPQGDPPYCFLHKQADSVLDSK
jgi:hypothetical protein